MICTEYGYPIRRDPRRTLGPYCSMDTSAAKEPERRPSTGTRSCRHAGHSLSSSHRMSVGCYPSRVRQPEHLLSSLRRMDQSRSFQDDACRDAPVLRRTSRYPMAVGIPRQRQREGAKRGGLTGPNPTDRAKLGTKRHVLTDGRGVPLAITLTGANVHDKWMVASTLDAVLLRAPRGPRRPRNLCLDKGYDYTDCEMAARVRGIKPHIRRRGEQPLIGCVQGKPRRWVVERTNSWHNNFRALRIRWETIAEHYLALVHMACAFIAYRAARMNYDDRF